VDSHNWALHIQGQVHFNAEHILRIAMSRFWLIIVLLPSQN
jgi:hypothetical protein